MEWMAKIKVGAMAVYRWAGARTAGKPRVSSRWFGNDLPGGASRVICILSFIIPLLTPAVIYSYYGWRESAWKINGGPVRENKLCTRHRRRPLVCIVQSLQFATLRIYETPKHRNKRKSKLHTYTCIYETMEYWKYLRINIHLLVQLPINSNFRFMSGTNWK